MCSIATAAGASRQLNDATGLVHHVHGALLRGCGALFGPARPQGERDTWNPGLQGERDTDTAALPLRV